MSLGVLAGRFELRRKLGAGGMGEVFEAVDRDRSVHVALKTLPQLSASALYRFKQEFRLLSGITHPNLVSLHELIGVGDQWLLTMELVSGVDFMQFVTSSSSFEATPTDAVTSDMLALASGPGSAGVEPLPPDGSTRRAAVDVPRLRGALRQLTGALSALHAADRLHLDIKPSNVLVTPEGRLVVLDFGLVVEHSRQRHDSSDEPVGGTVAYMAPEQASGAVGPAADWYAVGVMLYAALAGRLPFTGSAREIFTAKQLQTPDPPRRWNPAVPAALDALCVGLLATDPRQRFGAADILRAIDADGSAGMEVSGPRRGDQLVGRAETLRHLTDAFQRLAMGRPETVYVHGASGMGKSALVEGFLERVRAQPGTLVLTGRCYEQESVQYKALDGLIDGLSRYLRQLPASELRAILPHDVAVLARLFPVLDRVDAIRDAPRDVLQISSDQDLRDRAFATLRQLFSKLAARARLVLAIDDLQWGDVDSAQLLIDLMTGADAPALLLLGSHRTEHAASSPCLKALLSSSGSTSPQQVIEVGPLDQASATQLALTWLGTAVPMAAATAQRIANESGGSPYFIRALVEYVKTESQFAQPDVVVEGITLEEALRRRLGRLKPAARRLVEVIAVAARPMAEADAYAAADLPQRDPAIIGVLRNSHLVQSDGADDPQVVTYHDRVREAVVAQLGATALRHTHERLAAVLASRSDADPEWVGAHLEGAGAAADASECYARAAAAAASALAFDRAADLYRRSLTIGTPDDARRRALGVALGDALANAGRASGAGDAYLDAARLASDDEVLDLRRRAGYQLFISGRCAEGRALLSDCLTRVGLKMPAGNRQATLSLLLSYARLRTLERLDRLEPARTSRALTPLERLRLDVLWAAAAVMTDSDNLVAASLQARHLLMALRLGDAAESVRGLALYGRWMAYGGIENRERTLKIVSTATRLAAAQGSPYARAMAHMSQAWADFDVFEWTSGFQRLDDAESLLRTSCTGVAWELMLVRVTRVTFLRVRGLFREAVDAGKRALDDAAHQGDLYTHARVGMFTIVDELYMAGDYEGARRALKTVLPQSLRRQLPAVSLFARRIEVMHDLALDRPGLAWRRVRRFWPFIVAEGSFRIALVKSFSLMLRAGAALAAIDDLPAESRQLLADAERSLRALEKMGSGDALARADSLRACLAVRRGDRDRAIALFDRSSSWFEAHGLRGFGAANRRCQGLLLGGVEGRQMVDAADAWFTSQGYSSPAFAAASQVYGLPRAFIRQHNERPTEGDEA